MILPSPLVGYVAAAALAFAGFAGYTVRGWKCKADAARVVEQTVKREKELRDEIYTTAQAYEKAKDKANGLGAERAEAITEAFRDTGVPDSSSPVCIAPDDVVRLLQNSIESINPAPPGESGQPVPNP
tara:strand:- start:206 stop:589 length:384 start_codon:yes stop_codon:yes gene_type:complete